MNKRIERKLRLVATAATLIPNTIDIKTARRPSDVS